jgi:hypothetical protein
MIGYRLALVNSESFPTGSRRSLQTLKQMEEGNGGVGFFCVAVRYMLEH